MAARFELKGIVPMQLMQELVAMSNDRWLAPQRLRELAARFGVELLLARIAFHTGTKTALRKMPVKVFPDGEVRRAMLDTMQQVLDEAVAEEEEKEGS
jgi:type III secretion protein W